MAEIDWTAVAEPVLTNTPQRGNVPTRKFYGGMDADELHRKQIIEDFFNAQGVYAPEPAPAVPAWKRILHSYKAYAIGGAVVEILHVVRSLV